MAYSGSSNNGSELPLCAYGCGFYGNPKNQNLCSVCYTTFLKKSFEDSTTNEDVVRSEIGIELTGVRDDEENRHSEMKEIDIQSEASISGAKMKNRCRMCKKKVGLLGFNCRCGDVFCGIHRYPETHSCNVDYKGIGQQVLKKQVVECKGDKLEFRV